LEDEIESSDPMRNKSGDRKKMRLASAGWKSLKSHDAPIGYIDKER
jgi:hypothetical protein